MKDLTKKFPKLSYRQMLALNDIARGDKIIDVGRRYGYKVDEKYKTCVTLSSLIKKPDAQLYIKEVQKELFKLRSKYDKKEENLFKSIHDKVLNNWINDIEATYSDFVEVKTIEKSTGKKGEKIPYQILVLKEGLDKIPRELCRVIKSIKPCSLGGVELVLYDRFRSENALAKVLGLYKDDVDGSEDDIQSTVDSALGGVSDEND